METAGAFVACAVAFALGFGAGKFWDANPGVTVLVDIGIGVICAGAFFSLFLIVGERLPSALDPRELGFLFLIVLAAAPAVAGVATWLGHRRSVSRTRFWR